MNFTTSPDTIAVAELLKAASIGQTVTYAELSEALGSDVKSRFWIVRAALKMANNEIGALFTTVRGVGYQRIAADDAAKVGITARGRIRRIARRSSQTITNAMQHANDVAPERRARIMAEVSALALLAHVSKERTVTAATTTDNVPQPVAKTLAALVRDMGAA